MKTTTLVRVFDTRGFFLRISQIEKARTAKDGSVQLKCFKVPGWVGLEQVLPLKGAMN